jgi:hypothetical protein
MAFDEILQSLESISRFHVALYAPRRVFVHAGVVGWHDEAIVIPGMSFTGKSCLVDALVRAGATYYSDEFAVFDDRGYVHPYAKPITLRGKQDATDRKYRVESIGGRSGTRPIPVGLIVVSRYAPGAHWHPHLVSPGQAALALLANTVCIRHRPEIALPVLRRAVEGAAAQSGRRGEAEQIAESLLSYLEKRANWGKSNRRLKAAL